MENAYYSLEGLFQFLNEGVSPFHAAAAAARILEEQGYVHCPESAAWTLVPGGRYYTTRNGSAVLAWRMPTAMPPPGASRSWTAARTRPLPGPRPRATAGC